MLVIFHHNIEIFLVPYVLGLTWHICKANSVVSNPKRDDKL